MKLLVRIMSISKFFLLLFFPIFLISCEKKPVKNVMRIDPETEKLGKVLSSMSQECKNSVPRGRVDDFLADIHKVLRSNSTILGMENSKKQLFLISVDDDFIPNELESISTNELFEVKGENVQIRKIALASLEKMAEASSNIDIKLVVENAYIQNNSENKLGCSIDFYADVFTENWLSENASKFGWTMTSDKKNHYRYIGVEGCNFKKKWFSDNLTFMLEFLQAWRDFDCN